MDDDDVDDGALLLAVEGHLWLLAKESGGAKLGTEVVLGPSSRVVGDRAFFVIGDEWSRFPLQTAMFWTRVEVMEPPVPCNSDASHWLPWSHAIAKLSMNV